MLPYLTHVTATDIRINMVPDDSFDLRISLSLGSSLAWGVVGQVTQSAAPADVRTHLVAAPTATFTGLSAGTEYKYLAECRVNSSSPWQTVQRAYFRTLYTSTAAVQRIGVISDSHTYQAWQSETCSGVIGALAGFNLTRNNMSSRSIDFIVDDGDTAMVHCQGCAACNYTRENGDVVAFTADVADNQTEADARWELFLSIWQPLLAFKPFFEVVGNHEEIQGYGGAGDASQCQIAENETNRAMTAFKNMMGNYNDAYPNSSSTIDYDADTVIEDQRDGLYYEWASGSLRWFAIDSMRYPGDTGLAGAVPAAQFPGFVGRTSDQPATVYGNVPSSFWPNNNTDTYEDNATMGATQVGWFLARVAAKTETFGAVISHRIVGGIPSPPTCYYYQRGLVATGDTNADGVRSVTENWDADGDGDRADEHYIAARMVANGIQIRFVGHDHIHTICRKDGRHYIEIGRPGCTLTGDSCFPDLWFNPTGAAINLALRDIYDCNDDGALDADPSDTRNGVSQLAVSNGGINGTNGTLNPGFGLLEVNGTTSMQWSWVVSDLNDSNRNNTAIIVYGPITP